jgi:hypothetical protein
LRRKPELHLPHNSSLTRASATLGKVTCPPNPSTILPGLDSIYRFKLDPANDENEKHDMKVAELWSPLGRFGAALRLDGRIVRACPGDTGHFNKPAIPTEVDWSLEVRQTRGVEECVAAFFSLCRWEPQRSQVSHNKRDVGAAQASQNSGFPH